MERCVFLAALQTIGYHHSTAVGRVQLPLCPKHCAIITPTVMWWDLFGRYNPVTVTPSLHNKLCGKVLVIVCRKMDTWCQFTPNQARSVISRRNKNKIIPTTSKMLIYCLCRVSLFLIGEVLGNGVEWVGKKSLRSLGEQESCHQAKLYSDLPQAQEEGTLTFDIPEPLAREGRGSYLISASAAPSTEYCLSFSVFPLMH